MVSSFQNPLPVVSGFVLNRKNSIGARRREVVLFLPSFLRERERATAFSHTAPPEELETSKNSFGKTGFVGVVRERAIFRLR